MIQILSTVLLETQVFCDVTSCHFALLHFEGEGSGIRNIFNSLPIDMV